MIRATGNTDAAPRTRESAWNQPNDGSPYRSTRTFLVDTLAVAIVDVRMNSRAASVEIGPDAMTPHRTAGSHDTQRKEALGQESSEQEAQHRHRGRRSRSSPD
jgi:hypothetical protein